MSEDEDQENEDFAKILAKHGSSNCPNCGRVIDHGDVAWNSPSTSAGTPFTMVEIQCQGCDHEIAHIDSWTPWTDTFDQVLDILRQDWK